MINNVEKVNAGEKIILSSEYWNSLDLAQIDSGIVTHDFFSEGKYKKSEFTFSLEARLIEKLNGLTYQNDLPLFLVFITGLQIQLFKYTGKEENIIGIPTYVGNVKDSDGVKNKVLPLLNKVMKETTVKHLLKGIQENVFQAYENQFCDLDHLLKSSHAGNSVMDITPISISMNTLHSSESIHYITTSTKNQISVFIDKKDTKTFNISLVFNEELFKKETIELFGERFIRIIGEMVNDLDQSVKQINIITEKEKNQVLYEFNNTAMEYSKSKTIQELFEHQVEKTPHRIAVQYENQVLTYTELNEKANQLAWDLKNKGVQPGSIVAIMLNGFLEMVVSMIGVLKAGGAYLPIDIHHPIGRKEYMLRDAEVDIVISTKDLMDGISFNGLMVDFINVNYHGDKNNVGTTAASDDLAYVIYTSGTTGNPKGVMIEHKSLINYITYCMEQYQENRVGDFPLFTSISFDLTVTSIYVPLLSGNKIRVYNNNDQFSFTKIVEDPIDIMKLTPAHLSVVNGLDIDSVHLSKFIVGGEELSYRLVENIHHKFNGNVEIINEYGPTEATVGCIVYRYEEKSVRGKSLPIGTPINNSRVYILDEELNLVPKGVPGDLWIAGDGLARGYLNRPDLTSEKFVRAPFNPEERMYKTGDIARWQLDGTIEFYGRKDNQVKIRGFRIELGEIENRLLSHSDINEAVVLAREDENQEKQLVAYVVGEIQMDTSKIRDYLQETVPYYMVPSYIMQLESMPLTTNGKIARQALPEPLIDGRREYVAPRNDIEQKLAEIWAEVLGAEKIGIKDNFFDLGGDSIKAIRITSKLQKYGYKLEVQDLFNSGTIEDISDKVSVYSAVISQEEVTGEAPLTPIQKMFFENDFTNKHHWNQSIMIYNKEGFHEGAVQNVLREVTKHHDALRTIYKYEDKHVKQIIRGTDGNLFDLSVFDYCQDENYKEMIEECCDRIQSSIDLENGPLLKAGLFKTIEGDHLLIAIHHLVVDGVSWRILNEDFAEGYQKALNGEKIVLQDKTNSFKDWGAYLEYQAQSEMLQEELQYWKHIERADIKILPADSECSEESNKLKQFKRVDIEFSEEETEALLKDSNRAYHTEINDLLLTALGLTIREWTSEEQLLINLEGHGREELEGDIDISRTIGWFTTHYPVLLTMRNDKQLSYSLKNVKETLRQVPNKGIGYGILKYLGEGTSIERVKPQINFNYLGQFDEKFKNEIFELSSLAGGSSISSEAESLFEIDINGTVSNRKLGFTFAYNSHKYNETTIRKMAEAYKHHLQTIVLHCINKNSVELTPSDYSVNDLNIEELEELTGKYKGFTIKDVYPLTPMQEGMLFHSLLDNKSTAYFEQKSFTSKGGVNVDILEKSFNKLIERYDILRTVIVHENVRSPKQVILKERKESINYEDISGLTEEMKSEYIERYQLEDRKKGFNLSKDILIRLSVLKMNHEEYKMIWSSHHILMDGWCTGIIMKDFFAVYSSIKNNQSVSLKDPAPYVNYIHWLQTQSKEEAKLYWSRYLEGYAKQAQLPVSVKKNSHKSKKDRLEFNVDKKVTESLIKVSKQAQVTINTVIQTVWGILLQKYTNSEDVVFGSVVSGRNAEVEGIQDMIGLFINTIPTRIKNNRSTTFIDLIKEVQKDSLNSSKYDYFPLAEIQTLSEVKQKLINHILVFQNYYVDDEVMESNSLLDFEIKDVSLYEHNNYDFGVMVMPNAELTVRFSYNSNVYDRKSVISIKNHFIRILETITENHTINVSEIDITTDAERNQLLQDFNHTHADYPRGKTLQELFEEQAEKRPDHIAVAFENQTLTYQALNEKSNQLARVLRQKGVKPNSIVGIMTDSSLEMIIGILGILKSGGAYLPIDPAHPADRISYMMNDAEIDLLVTTDVLARDTSFEGTIIDLKDQRMFEGEQGNVEVLNKSDDAAYVIYTSGTTGKAKGVMIQHSSLVNYCHSMIKKASITSDDETALLSSYAFDLGYTTVYTALISGITLHILSEDTYKDPDQLVEFAGKHCTYLKMTPSLFSIMIHSDKIHQIFETGRLRLLILGGESINPKDVKKFVSMDQAGKITLMNHYGPTESTIGCVAGIINPHQIDESPNVIGTPLDNTKAYILDPQKNLSPIGVPGELYISGEGLARGYINKPELTAEKFIDSPFEPGARMYKTGDLAKRLRDGRIEFLGRIDNQVKVRGYRIELGEIENALLSHPEIKEAAVVDRENGEEEKYLVAYIAGQAGLDVSEIRDYLKESLPHYMIPAYFMVLDSMPLTQNGKVNLNGLPEPNINGMISDTYEAPQNALQETLVKIWSEILGVKKIGINDNFFDLGGDSIKAIRITSRLQKYGYKLEVKHLFNYGNVKEISEKVTVKEKGASQKAVIGEAPLTPIQNMFFENNFTNKHHWNQSVMICSKEGFHEEAVQFVLDELTVHHDALRTVYKLEEKDVKQFIRGTDTKLCDLQVWDYRSYENYQEMIEESCQRIQSSIYLEKGPLVKAGLFKTYEGDHLLIAIHHLVVDGVSWRILFEDFAEGYQQALNGEKIVFQDKTNSFKDWGEYLEEQAQSDLLNEELGYWEKILKSGVRHLPTDKNPHVKHNKWKDFKEFRFELSREDTEDLLKKTNRAYNTEINDLLLTALGLAFKEWTSEDQLLVTLEGHGREILEGEIDISRTVGWFTTHYPVLINMPKAKQIDSSIKNVKETLRHIPNKGIGFGVLKYLGKALDSNGINSQIKFNYLGQFDEDIKNDVFELSELPSGNSISLDGERLFEIDINGIISNHKLGITFTYNSEKYHESTMIKVAEAYKIHLLKIIEHCKNREKVELTPSDYSDSDMTLEELEKLKKKYELNHKKKIKDIFPLTPMQKGMLFHSLLDKGSTAYFEQKSFTSKGKLDVEILEKSFKKLIDRYDILRTVIAYEDVKTPKQVILENCKASIHLEDISALKEDQLDYMNRFLLEDRKKGFNLSEEILIRLSVLKLNNEEYKVIWSSHHILMDGWCGNIIMNDLFAFYASLKNQQHIDIKEPARYGDYIKWLQKQPKNKAEHYWEHYLKGYGNHAQLPSSSREEGLDFKKERLNFTIDKRMTESLMNISKQAKVTINTVIQAVWGILLQKYTNMEDVVFGSVVSGRNAKVEGIEEMIGLFINTVPIRVKSSSESKFIDLVKEIQKNSLESSKYDYYPLAEIQSLSEVKQQLINHIMIFQNYYVDESLNHSIDDLGLNVNDLNVYEQTNYDFDVMVIPRDELTVMFSYNGNLFNRKNVTKIKNHFIQIIQSVVENHEINISELDMTTEAEKQQLLVGFNDTKADYPKEKTLHRLFEEQAEKSPD
ncbi:amino acid adenylation domain-containing protein, partial [Peribacillus simplex]|uniref:non-ribosomal peptide synthetase n=1 Tax=Peribacillus simplex TaxID=1478 RepID=UPI00298E3672